MCRTARVVCVFALVAGAGLLPAVVVAQPGQPAFPPPPTGPAPPPAPRRTAFVSATMTPFSLPLHLFELTRPNVYPIVSVAIELRAHPRFGIAVMGLAGDETSDGMYVQSHDTFYEYGVEPRWYFMGGFRGPLVGAALHYFRMHMILTDNFNGWLSPFDFAGYTYGPFAGYKWTARIGFTIEAKTGFVAIKRTMSDSGDHPDFMPMVDGKVGWSF